MGHQQSPDNQLTISLGRLHAGQMKAYRALMPHRLMALRCGRRFGKTEFAKIWIKQGIIQGEATAWFAPQHMLAGEVAAELAQELAPLLISKGDGVMRFTTGGRLDFWSLENPRAGRSRGYRRLVIDEAAFAKNSDGSVGPMMEIWERSIKPTLFDWNGKALVCSNSAGKDPENFFYNICTDAKLGFREFHATTMDNEVLPKRLNNEGYEAWLQRRAKYLDDLKRDNDPLVYAQEYLADFVNWSGKAFFNSEKLLIDGKPIPNPTRCDFVLAVIDTASKSGTEHDGTAVTYVACDGVWPDRRLMILDWDIVQIDGALLEIWLPTVMQRLEELSKICGARRGSAGAFIEDKNSGTILLQQAIRREIRVHAINSELTAAGKDGRAISVSGYVHREMVKYTDYAYNKIVDYKQQSINHLVTQVENFRVGEKDNKRADDLLDTFCYAIAITLGNGEGF